MAAIIRTRRVFGRAKADINITPLIDVLLVLIVIFMVITPLTPMGLEANVPQPSPRSSEAPRENTLILSLSHTGGIRLNQQEVDAASILSRLQEVLSTRSDRTLFVQADDDVLYDDVAQLIDMARGAGATRIGLMTHSRGCPLLTQEGWMCAQEISRSLLKAHRRGGSGAVTFRNAFL